MSRSDRGDRRRQRLPSEARLRERKGKAFMYLKPFSPSVTTYAVTPSRLLLRSVLLLRRGVRGTPAPQTPGRHFCTNPWLPLTRELSSEARLRERKGKAFMYLKPFSPSVTTYAVPPSRLPPRSALLLRRGVRRTPAPQTPWRQRFVQTEGLF